jgi:hypothetical protein
MSTDSTTLAIIEIGVKIASFVLGNTTLGTENVTDAAANALALVKNGSISPPGTGLVFPGASRSKYH